MRTMTVNKTSVFPAAAPVVFEKLCLLQTLQTVAWPYLTFVPQDTHDDGNWQIGTRRSYRLKLFYGLIPFGTHHIDVIHMDEHGIETHERNDQVPLWNHTIRLDPLPDGRCRYTDRVEIGAGWKTVCIYWWAKMFYAHRQRKWIRLLKGERQDTA